VSIIEIISTYREGFANGLLTTLKLCLIVWFVGFFVGTFIGILGSKFKLMIGMPSRIISFILSGTPVLVFLFWVHYPLQTMLNVIIDPFYTTAMTISIINIFAVAEIVRNGISELPQQYIEAAKVYGITPKKRLVNIELPIIFRFVLPSFLILQVNMLHLTLFGSLISVDEIFRTCQRVNAQIYQPIEIYTALGIFFIIVCLPLNSLAYWLKIKFSRDLSER
jgi:His/Glu/Gln/Arg/opine family amino acid ABC transporter permease subunit